MPSACRARLKALGGVHVACGQGVFRIDQLQRTGKAALSAQEFLRGTAIEVGAPFAPPPPVT